jgi:sugar lactone lactonase YvrE
VLFTVVLCVATASQVLADTPAEESPITSELESHAPSESPVALPTSEDVAQGLQAVEREEREREEELETPAAQHEREVSRTAYTGLDPVEAQQLFESRFGEVIATLNNDPARFLSDAKLDRPLGEGSATVTSDGNTALLEAGMPVETKNDEGELSKVDLSLEQSQEGWAPANPLVEVNVGESAAEGVEVGNEGLAITQAGAEEDSTAEPLGDKNLWFSEVEEGSDTDLMVSPTSMGVELFDLLRSPDSPETLHFHLQLPEGADVQPNASGGAEVLASDGTVLTQILTPTAVDAQGTEVPVTLEVEGETISLRVEHHDAEVAYPILVDPNIVQDWYNASWYNNQNLQGLNAWYWKDSQNPHWIDHGTNDTSWPGHRCLCIATEPTNIPPYQSGEFFYPAPNSSTYLEKAFVYPFWRENRNCTAPNPYPEPHDYDAMWGDNGWNRFDTDDANRYGASNMESWGHAFFIGMSSGGSWVNLPCWRDLMIGGVAIWLDDWNYPYLSSVEEMPQNKWYRKDDTPHSFKVTAVDEGLGVHWVRMFGVGSSEWGWNKPMCAGTYEDRCPNTQSGEITFTTAGFPYEGEVGYSVQVEDPTWKKWTEREMHIRVDGVAPTVNLSGEFATVTAEAGSKENKEQEAGHDKLSLPTYNLKIKAEDGSPTVLRSGVQEVKLYLDGSQTPLATKANKTPCDSCSLEWTYPVTLTGLTEGKHTLELAAVDEAGNEAPRTERKIEFEYIPATGMKEEYILQHFALPDGRDYSGEPEYRGPELAVNVTNGNLVYHERDFMVQAPRASLELERVYNSQQPTAKDAQWGHGWSLAQTPELKPESGKGPQRGKMVRSSAITSAVNLPESETQSTFSPTLHATVDKTSTGGYEVDYENREEASVFASNGQIQEARFGDPTTEVQALPESPRPIYMESFGSSGSGNGQFSNPADVAIDFKGNLWIVDKANNRIEQFTERGESPKTFGSLGSTGGKLSSPSGIVIDPTGNVWVTDTANTRVQEFNEKGEFVATFGTNVNKTKVESSGTQAEKNLCTAASKNVCQAGTAGGLEGQMKEPMGIAASSGGNLYVVEKGNGRVEKFSPTGELLAKFGGSGSGSGQFKEPSAIAVAPDASIWVADSGNNRVQHWSSTFSLIGAFGKEGSGNGEFKYPDAIDVDTKGDVWVGDQKNQRIQELNQSGGYLAQFGSAGSEEEQFNLGSATGITIDARGRIWVADTGNNRVQKWVVPHYTATYVNSFGSTGSGNGQFSHPAGIAIDAKRNLWVVDDNNYRVEKFNEKGEYLSAIGAAGPGNGQFGRPTDVAIDPKGNIWVTDASNNRVEKFNEKGEYVSKVGTAGSGNLQFSGPESIAADSKGNIWVGDTYNHRVEELNEKGEFVRAFGTNGSGQGQILESTGIAIGPGNNVWVADWGNNRVEEFSETGTFIRQFGSEGTGNGQFKRPDVIDVDSKGNVWVGDQNNERFQEFNQNGEYLTQFGAAGSGQGQFSFGYPMGIATDALGHIWISDTGNNRVQEFFSSDAQSIEISPEKPTTAVRYTYSGTNLTKMALEEPSSSTDPSLGVSVSNGLTTSVNAESAGTASFAYEGGKLTSEKDPESEAKFSWDTSNRLKKVELLNGTWAKVEFDTLSRVIAVTVKAAGGAEKVTHFWYGTEPHETKVWGGGNPEIIYSIGEDGSVFKWAYAEVPPTIEPLSGSLWDVNYRNSTTPVPNKDQTLFVTASSPHEIASIKVLVNGESVAEEEICEDNSVPPSHVCEHVTMKWITNPAEHAPGQLNLEVVATDFQGHSSAERFFVTIPVQPPPELAAPEKPNFKNIKLFREDYGLDREHPLSKSEMNDLALELLYEWEAQRSTAVASVENWGVPMRAPELAEMEYRREYTARAAEEIPEWAEEHAASTYGGFYVDDRAGGLIYVGFTENQHAAVESLKQDPNLLNPGAIREYPAPPTTSISSLTSATLPSVSGAIESTPSINAITSFIYVAPESNAVQVGTTEPEAVRAFLTSRFGQNAPIRVLYEAPPVAAASRYTSSGPLAAGSGLIGFFGDICTSGFGSRAAAGEIRGVVQYKYFVLTAAHCYLPTERVGRQTSRGGEGVPFGWIRRRPYEGGGVVVDGEAISIDENYRSHSVLNGDPLEAQPIQGVQAPRLHHRVCWSAIHEKVCGPVTVSGVTHPQDGFGAHNWVFLAHGMDAQGDSGGPVWDPETHKAVGLITAATGAQGGKCWREGKVEACNRMMFTPLLPIEGAAGVVPTLGVEVLEEG